MVVSDKRKYLDQAWVDHLHPITASAAFGASFQCWVSFLHDWWDPTGDCRCHWQLLLILLGLWMIDNRWLNQLWHWRSAVLTSISQHLCWSVWSKLVGVPQFFQGEEPLSCLICPWHSRGRHPTYNWNSTSPVQRLSGSACEEESASYHPWLQSTWLQSAKLLICRTLCQILEILRVLWLCKHVFPARFKEFKV